MTSPRNESGGKDKSGPPTTWKEVEHSATQLLGAAVDFGKIQLPFGKLPDAATDLKCSEWLDKVLLCGDIELIFKTPRKLKPWIGARMIVTAGIAAGWMMRQAPPPPDGTMRTIWDIAVRGWDCGYKHDWPKWVFDPDTGGIRYTGNAPKDGEKFGPN